MRPLLGVICDTLGPASDPRQGVAERYLAVAPYVDADLVLIPSIPQDAARLVSRLDGVFLTGSPSNVAPARYGAEDPGAGPFDEARDAVAFALIEACARAEKPLLGICRGFQEVAVAYGSVLRRELDRGALPHHAGDERTLPEKFAHRHGVTLTPGGALSRAMGAAEIMVNSVHFQGVARLGEALRPEAMSPDGVPEAARLADARGRVLAVQWHPEWDAPHDPVARTVLEVFGLMLRGATLDQAGASAGAMAGAGMSSRGA